MFLFSLALIVLAVCVLGCLAIVGAIALAQHRQLRSFLTELLAAALATDSVTRGALARALAAKTKPKTKAGPPLTPTEEPKAQGITFNDVSP